LPALFCLLFFYLKIEGKQTIRLIPTKNKPFHNTNRISKPNKSKFAKIKENKK
jgi:hypothetical protein